MPLSCCVFFCKILMKFALECWPTFPYMLLLVLVLHFLKLNSILVFWNQLWAHCICVHNHILKFILNSKNLILKNFLPLLWLCPFSFLIRMEIKAEKKKCEQKSTNVWNFYLCLWSDSMGIDECVCAVCIAVSICANMKTYSKLV